YAILGKANLRVLKLWGISAGFVLLTGSWFFFKHGVVSAKSHGFEATVLSLAVVGVFVWTLAQKDNPKPIETMAATIFGIVYVSWLFNFITKIHYIEGGVELEGGRMLFHGKFAVLYLVLVTKLSDAGAYVTGKLLGRHKLIPRISPGKTWEGTLGAVVVAALAGLGTFFLFRDSLEHLRMTPVHAAMVGALLGAVGVVGDLAESLIKREAGVKDSGHWLPGIGGILDLIDSLLFTAPALYAYLRLILR
ncbi:MAG: phosphatidate cytidylyltransferase, partial [Verrucomicrobia bacterium]|nr:phosphatidate cytidylyltransferase [Verrucomicrobiota bacterium]